MTPQNARRILGLGLEEDPRPHFPELENARARIAAMVSDAPNETLAARYRKGLAEFDEALEALKKPEPAAPESPPISQVSKPKADLEAEEKLGAKMEPASEIKPEQKPEPVSPAPPPAVLDDPVPPEPPTPATAVLSGNETPARKGRGLSFAVWFLVFLVGAAGGTWLFLKDQKAKELQRGDRVAFLERQAAMFTEARNWEDAEAGYAEIATLVPGSEIVVRGREAITAGVADEQRQFVGYWTGQATADIEAGRLDEAEAAARKVLKRFPHEREAADLLKRIEAARLTQNHEAAVDAAHKSLAAKDWDVAIAGARKILATAPQDAAALEIVSEANAGIAKTAVDLAKAREIFATAQARDQGQFDQEALDLVRQAAVLAPDDKEIAALLEKFSSYTRTLRVPGDFENPAAAIAAARDRDRIVLGAGTWEGPIIINVAIELQGTGTDETRIECAPDAGSAITLGPDAAGARISGISFRHNKFAAGDDRYSAVLIRGGVATFADCHFTDASGHGLAVIEGGHVTASHCKFMNNGWDGVTAIGKGSTLEISESESLNNFEHGIESWDGAACILTNNRCEGNSRNGIHADNGLASATIEGNQLNSNREFGLVVDSAKAGKISGNTAKSNLLGGFVIRAAAAGLPFISNTATRNEGPGLVLEKGLPAAAYAANSITQNDGVQIMSDTDLSEQAGMPVTTPAKIPKAIIVPESELVPTPGD